MNEIIKVTQDENGNSVVSGRDLHEFLEVQTQYTKWFDRMVDYGFTENTDFVAISQKRLTAQGNETTYTDHALTLDMAKEISMIQRTEKGKQARQYFIAVEKEFKKQYKLPQTPEEKLALTMQVTLRLDKRVGNLEKSIDEIQNKSEIDSDQRYKLWVARNKKAVEALGGKESNAYKDKALSRKTFRALEHSLKKKFVISRYEDLKKENFDEAIETINKWYPPYELQCEIEEMNAQGKLF
ncbi:ORF6C domain-containing protein [Ligilactobacillus salivarius]|uniref:ORF6C domain-containing protein n=1 Tax=Ligilactobacillus salivarius TaxID=1624 RepID=UPI00187A42B3|nr:ORF6C domain-containing protein [Ligilactobacillus salivarius]MBE7387049.1 ORF6C domain-containing protein [Ligilactobacillus salivarius]MBE7392278.1 ORF6C domain-containing protein [Ligilactobacillus salivarius]